MVAALFGCLPLVCCLAPVTADDPVESDESPPSQPVSDPFARSTEIVLSNRFIETYMGRATITTTFTVDRVGKVNLPKNDGDLHIAGRAPEVGLPIVAEVMNAGRWTEALLPVRGREGKPDTIPVTGAWRVWCEHAGIRWQTQGEVLERPTNSNPEHVFEIHPVTRIGDQSFLDSLAKIDGFKPHDAQRAFLNYERIPCRVYPDAGRTRIFCPMAGYNYVDFQLEITGEQQVVEDGRMLSGSVRSLDGELLVRGRRMVFVKDTGPERAVRGLKVGDKLSVLGMPRMDLEMIYWRSQNGRHKGPHLDFESLPYEMVIVAVYKDEKP
jgi:hypothetical protein